MRLLYIFLLFTIIEVQGQDAYHTSTLEDLNQNFGLMDGELILSDNEVQNLEGSYTYGNVTVLDEVVADQIFTIARNIKVAGPGTNPWDAGTGFTSMKSISSDDLILVTFWARQLSNSSQILAFAEDVSSFEKEYYFPINLTPDWTQYYVAFSTSKQYNVGRLQLGFHLATQTQEVEIAGFMAINYEDKHSISDLPSSFSPFDYDGRDLDAPWRALAETRIENIRKADLNIIVKDNNGNPIPEAQVSVDMEQHSFGFGSALVTCRFPGNNCYDATYVDKVINLDGEGHGFNECVNENALKWRGWEQEWLGTPEETVGAFRWLTEQGVTMRGHNLIWPGSQYLPDDINENLNDINYLRTRIHNRLEEMIQHPELSNYVRDWDVLNEITTNRTLESAFNSDPNLENGRKLYNEIFTKTRELDPDLELYINDYMAISSGAANLVAVYKSFLDELIADNVPFDGIGFQCHIGSVPNSIPKVEQIFNEFYQRYGKRMKVTEYDINPVVDEATQADYMRDLLTLTFSHPGMDAFIMWGFWDGNHWKDNAPMFYEDWSLKPSGEVFINNVFDKWWTNETALTSADGVASFRPFKGKHKVSVTYNGETEIVEVDLSSDQSTEVTLNGVSSIKESISNEISIFPTLSTNGTFQITLPSEYPNVDLDIIDSTGRKLRNFQHIENNTTVDTQLPQGKYEIIINVGNYLIRKSFIKL